jgi:hypothetical protein
MHEMIALSFHAEKGYFDVIEQPLCFWSNHKGTGHCDYYGECESEWGLEHFNGPTYEGAKKLKPDGFFDNNEANAEPIEVATGNGLYDVS